jgi:MoaA/NifB/PqqE/SkfB family radical SAM enzyme
VGAGRDRGCVGSLDGAGTAGRDEGSTRQVIGDEAGGVLAGTDMIEPTFIRVEASSHCQLRCPACPTTNGEIDQAIGKGFLKADDFRRFLERNPSIRGIELSSYGEIFLNPQLVEILRIAHEHNVALTAANGVNLNNITDEALEAIVKFRLWAMTCSIDGASAETYRIYRVRGNFDRVIANISKINRWKEKYRSPYPDLRWQFIVFRHNEHELPKAREMAKELGMKFFAKLSWTDTGTLANPEVARRETGAASRAEFEERFGRDYAQDICNQLWDRPQVNFDGKMLGCCRNFWGDFGANAFTEGLVASVNSEKMTHARRMLCGDAASRPDIPCATCEIYLGMQRRGKWLERPEDKKESGHQG